MNKRLYPWIPLIGIFLVLYEIGMGRASSLGINYFEPVGALSNIGSSIVQACSIALLCKFFG